MFGFEETLTPQELEAKQSKPMKNMGKTKQTNENKEKAEAEYYVGNWDTEGRAKLKQLQKRRLNLSSTRYEKWDSYDKYLLETHLVEIRKKHLQHEKHRSAAEAEEAAREDVRARRNARRDRGEDRNSAGKGDETYQRRDVEAILVDFV